MTKYAYKSMIIVLIIMLLINIIFFSRWLVEKHDDVYVVEPSLESMKVTTKLYFVYDGQLRSEERTISIKNNEFEKSIFEELLKGPKMKFYKTIFKNAKINSFEVIDDVIYIDFNRKSFTDHIINDEDFSLHMMALVNTLTEMKYFMKVQILVGGAKISPAISEINIFEPLTRNELFIFKKEINSSDVVISFTELIFNRKFYLAYDLLDVQSKIKYPFNSFSEKMEEYICEHEGYQIGIYFMQNYEDYDIVKMKFIEIKPEDQIPNDFMESWRVEKINGEFKVNMINYIDKK